MLDCIPFITTIYYVFYGQPSVLDIYSLILLLDFIWLEAR